MVEEQVVKQVVLEEAYRLMGLGIPDKFDFQGFNKPDWTRMANLLPSLVMKDETEISDEICAFIADTLVKYSRQINEPFYSWIKKYAIDNNGGAENYMTLKRDVNYETVAKESKKNKIEAYVVDGGNVEIQFKYDPDLLNAVKTIPGVKARYEGHGRSRKWFWAFPLIKVLDAIEILEDIADVTQLHNVLDDNRQVIKSMLDMADHPETAIENTRDEEGRLIINAQKSGEMLLLSFPYDARLVEVMRGTPGKKWLSATKQWSIPVSSAEDAYFAFCEFDDVDPSELEDYLPEGNYGALDESTLDLARYGSLFEHQETGIKFMLKPKGELKGSILGDDMGLGKTRQAIIAASEMAVNNEETDKILVISPASLKPNWEREIRMVYPNADIFGVNGQGWVEDEVEECQWVIINYDLLKKHENEILAHKWAVVIADEAHYLKNRDAIRTKVFLGHRPRSKAEGNKVHPGIVNNAGNVLLLTGTPITSRPSDLFNLLKACNHPLAKNWRAFVFRYCNATQGRFGLDTSGSSNLEELHKLTKNVLLRRTKEECLDLPEKTRVMMPVAVDITQYLKYWKDYKVRLAQEGRILQAEHLAMLVKLRQSSALAKIPASIELAETVIENDKKVIIFTNFTEVVDQLMAHFGSAAVKVVGGMSAERKQEAVDAFQQNSTVKVFVGNIQAAGVGLTLTKATEVIFNDYSWLPSDHLQAEDRAYRIGQHNAVTAYYLNAEGTIDMDVSPVLASKLEVISHVVDGKHPENNDITGDLIKLLWGDNAVKRSD